MKFQFYPFIILLTVLTFFPASLSASFEPERSVHVLQKSSGLNSDHALFRKLIGNKTQPGFEKQNKISVISSSLAKNESSAEELKISGLINTRFAGCGCSGISMDKTKKRIFWSAWKQNPDEQTVIFNINGKDTEFKLIKKDDRPEDVGIGDKFSDEYAGSKFKIIIDFTTRKLPEENCGDTHHDVTVTIIGEYEAKVISLNASCGC